MNRRDVDAIAIVVELVAAGQLAPHRQARDNSRASLAA
jgi:hypothetical protein